MIKNLLNNNLIFLEKFRLQIRLLLELSQPEKDGITIT